MNNLIIKNTNLNKFYLILASFFFSLMTVCVKKVDYRIPIYEIVFFRSIFSLITTEIIIKKREIKPWGERKLLLVIRGLLGTLALICIFYAIRNMPLSIATVIQYTYPIFISIFAISFINETCNRNIFAGLIFGWIGVLIILNPSKLAYLDANIKTISIVIAFIGAISTSMAYITVKKLSETENIFVIIKYFPLISVIILLPITIFNWVTPNLNDLIWILGIGLFTQIGQTLLTLGLKNLPASLASTINYLQVLFASLWGIYFFGEKISTYFILGSIFVLLGTFISTSKIPKKI